MEYRQGIDEIDEDDELEQIKGQIRETKEKSVFSSRNALRLAKEAEDSGRATLERLGEQSDKFSNTERDLDTALGHNRYASEKARQLRTLNKSIFAVHVSNPFNSKSKNEEKERLIAAQYDEEQMLRAETRQSTASSRRRVNQALQDNFRSTRLNDSDYKVKSMNEQSKFQFEADAEDDQLEEEIGSNLNELGDVAGRLKSLAVAINGEVDGQNRRLDKIADKSDKVGAGIHMNTERLKRLR